jgi:hypothetical protein
MNQLVPIVASRAPAIVGVMVYSFARIGAAIGMRVEDVYRRLWVRLSSRGGDPLWCAPKLIKFDCFDRARSRGHRARVGAARVRVSDLRREEFEEARPTPGFGRF